jgi:hypothetical protein
MILRLESFVLGAVILLIYYIQFYVSASISRHSQRFTMGMWLSGRASALHSLKCMRKAQVSITCFSTFFAFSSYHSTQKLVLLIIG